MANNIDTNPCDNDLDRTKTVDKIQVRRGKSIDTPQPLKAGEFGFAMDDKKLYIGTSCDYTPSGVQVEIGEFSNVQTLIDNSTIKVELTQAYTQSEWDTFKQNITAAHPAVEERFQTYNDDTTILIGIPSGFTDTAGLITTIESQQYIVTPVSVGSGYTVNMTEGTISMSSDVLAGMLVHVLNNIVGNTIASNLLNVKVFTEGDISIEDIDNWNEAYSWGDHSIVGYELQANKGVANGYTPLDGDTKIPTQYLPSLSITEVYSVADIPARDAISPVQEGDVAIVTDASADPNVGSGSASYIYDGSAWQQLESPDDVVQTVNGESGHVILELDDLDDVNSSTATTDQLVRFDGTNWVNFTVDLDYISDVSAATPSTDDALRWDGTNWVPDNLSDKSDVGHEHDTADITSGTMDYARLPISSTQVTNWDTAYDTRIDSVSGGGNGTLTLTRPDATNLTTSLAHTHGASDLTMAMDDLSDVSAASPNDKNVVKWISANSQWESAPYLDYWLEDLHDTTPNDTRYTTQWTVDWNVLSSESDVNIALTPRGTGAIQAQVADATATGGDVRGPSAVDFQMNRASDDQVASGSYSVVSGGSHNRAFADYSTVSGGFQNTTIGGTYEGEYATVGGGRDNEASGDSSAISGGEANTASGWWAAIAGGRDNDAVGDYSFAMGRRAKANHIGSMVLSDDQDADESTTQTREMRLRFANGVYVNGNLVETQTASDEALKTDISDMSSRECHTVVSMLTPKRFRWKSDMTMDDGIMWQEIRNIAPTCARDNKTVDYRKLSVYLIGSNKYLTEKINDLEKKIDEIIKKRNDDE